MYKAISILTIVVIGNCQDTSFNFRENSGHRHNSRLQQNSEIRHTPEIHQYPGFPQNYEQNSDYQQNSAVRRSPELRHNPDTQQISEFRLNSRLGQRPQIGQDSELQENTGYRHNPRTGYRSELEQDSDDVQRNSGYRHNPRLGQRTETEQDSEQNSNSRRNTGYRLSPEPQQNLGFRKFSSSTPSSEPRIQQSTRSRQNRRPQQNSNNPQTTETPQNSKARQTPRSQESPESKTGRVPVYAPDKCPENQLLYPEGDEDDWTCDCGPGYIYHPASDGCFSAYRQGPCSRGQHLILKKDKSVPECVSNPCKEGYARYKGKCYELGKVNGPCPSAENGGGVFDVNTTTLAVECITGTNKLSLFDIPPNVEKCPPGSKRDTLKKCRQNWNTR